MFAKLLARLKTRDTVTSVLDAAGLAAITAGVALLSVPVGVITAGVALCVLGWVLA